MNITAKHNMPFNADSQKLSILINLEIADSRPIVSFWSVDSHSQ